MARPARSAIRGDAGLASNDRLTAMSCSISLATSRGQVMKQRVWMMALLGSVLFASPTAAEEVAAPQQAAEGDQSAQSLSEVNKKLSNPVSEIWSLVIQQNTGRVDPGHGENPRWSSNLIFQPVLPVAITDDWNLITRPVIPLFASQPHPEVGNPSRPDRSTAFGDTTLLQLISPGPKLAGDWLLGVGPSWIFPTAASDFTGQGKWQVGPGAVVGYLSDKWILGALVQNWWSFAGEGGRADTNGMNLQPIAAWFLPNGWSVGYSGNILANWESDRGRNTWTVPVGAAVSKVQKFGRLPVKFSLGLQWFPVQPENYGQDWNIQLQIVPVIPKLIKGNLTEPSSLQFGMH
jgi:hypothetical protein